MKFKLVLLAILIFATVDAFTQSANKMKEAVSARDYESAVNYAVDAVKENPKDVEILLLAGDVFIEMDRLNEAYDAYQKAYNSDKKNINALNKYGRALSMSGKHNEAIEFLIEGVKKNQKDQSVYLELANAYLRTDSLNRAEMLITQARELDKKSPAAFIALGDLYLRQRVFELARMNFEEALLLDDKNVDARVKLAIAYFRLGNQETDQELMNELYNRSLDEWNKITQQDPNNARAFYEQGRLLFFGGQYGNAAKSLNNFVILRPSGSLGRWYLAQSLEKIGACDSAIKHLDIVAGEIDSVRKQANYLKALCLFDTKQYDKAVKQFEFISQDTALPAIDIQRWGQAHLLLDDTLKALEIWEKAVEVDPEASCRIMNQMGILYQKLKIYDKSIAVLNKRINVGACTDEYQHIVYYYLGLSHIQSGDAQGAIEPLQKSIEANNEFLFSRISLADAFASLENFNAADSIFKSTIEIAKGDTANNGFVLTQAYSKLAGMYLDMKKFNEVAKIAEDWAKVYENEPFAYLYAAIAYHNLSNGKLACTNYRKVLKLDPKNASASKNLKSLEDAGQCQ
ncbi:MAG: tetratricopeptide repeat protein [Candidatus Kapabacteria bacterium]|nr:tetratricopeptide repeat protein [Ignavibacteriota bacterium]MCW5884464.1 tetratricopeptide repeat protein [Candidatus Kapabacteria bacterium]